MWGKSAARGRWETFENRQGFARSRTFIIAHLSPVSRCQHAAQPRQPMTHRQGQTGDRKNPGAAFLMASLQKCKQTPTPRFSGWTSETSESPAGMHLALTDWSFRSAVPSRPEAARHQHFQRRGCTLRPTVDQKKSARWSNLVHTRLATRLRLAERSGRFARSRSGGKAPHPLSADQTTPDRWWRGRGTSAAYSRYYWTAEP